MSDDLDELAAAAEKATPGYYHPGVEAWKGDFGLFINDKPTQDFVALANPSTILDLIAQLREARAESDKWKDDYEREHRLRLAILSIGKP